MAGAHNYVPMRHDWGWGGGKGVGGVNYLISAVAEHIHYILDSHTFLIDEMTYVMTYMYKIGYWLIYIIV